MNKEELKAKYGKKRVPHEWRGTNFINQMVTTFFGSGMSPKAPGTMGSLAAAIVAYPMAKFFQAFNFPEYTVSLQAQEFTETSFTFLSVNIGFLAAALIVFFGAVPFVNKAMKDTATEDPGWIVIDEVCGIFMALALITSERILTSPWILLVAFGVFRFFDILKPLGIHRFEQFPGAWGVMADDLLGGVYAAIVTFAVSFALLAVIP